MQQKVKNRWLIAAAAVGIHLSIGSVYAWSVFTKPITSQFGWELSSVQLTFSIAILFLGLSAAFLGHYVEKHGPRKAGILSSIFFGVGITGSGLAISMESLPLLYICYGVLGGIGLGVGYITPVSTLVKWFPDRRGLATGLAIMGFGFASMIAGPIIQALIESVGIANTFFILGIIYFVVMFCFRSIPGSAATRMGAGRIFRTSKRGTKADQEGPVPADRQRSGENAPILLAVADAFYQRDLWYRDHLGCVSDGARDCRNVCRHGGNHGWLERLVQRSRPHRLGIPV